MHRYPLIDLRRIGSRMDSPVELPRAEWCIFWLNLNTHSDPI
jgi:hypothetical protein